MSHEGKIFIQSVPQTSVMVSSKGRNVVVGLQPVILNSSEFPIQLKSKLIHYEDVVSIFESRITKFLLYDMDKYYFDFNSNISNIEEFSFNNIVYNFQELFKNNETFRTYSILAFVSTSVIALIIIGLIIYFCRKQSLPEKIHIKYKSVKQKSIEEDNPPKRPPKLNKLNNVKKTRNEWKLGR